MLTNLTGVGLVLAAVVSVMYFGMMWYFKRHNIVVPTAAADWIKALGGQVLVDAYYEAEAEAKEPDAKRDMAAALIQAAAMRYFGYAIPADILNLMIEFVVNLIQHEGEKVVADFVANFPGGEVTPTEKAA